MKKGQAKLLEPIMKVEVTTPEEHMGDVIGDISSRRGTVRGPTCLTLACGGVCHERLSWHPRGLPEG